MGPVDVGLHPFAAALIDDLPPHDRAGIGQPVVSSNLTLCTPLPITTSIDDARLLKTTTSIN